MALDDRLIKLGKRIRSFRKDIGITQDDLANLAGIERSYMGRIERGEKNITVDTLYRISNVLKVRASELLPD